MTTDVSHPAALRADRVRAIASDLSGLRGPLLPVLHAVQHELGHVDAADVPVISDVLNLAIAEVHGVVTFYRDFRREAGGRTTLRICPAEACQAVGATALGAHARRRLGVEFGQTTSDGAVTLEEVFCLG
ncbi:MAG: NAD(P)H-dependent oxidoreductase subunit E, partial [Actinomycetes bacterium]